MGSAKSEPQVDINSSCSVPADVKKIHVLLAAAGARFDKQLRELRKEVQSMRNEATGEDRWPGRVLPPKLPLSTLSDDESTGGSMTPRSMTPSIVGLSDCGSARGLGTEEKA